MSKNLIQMLDAENNELKCLEGDTIRSTFNSISASKNPEFELEDSIGVRNLRKGETTGLVCCHTRVLKTHFCVLKLCCINWVTEKLSTEATYTSIYRVFGRFIAEKR